MGGEFELHPRFHVKSLVWRVTGIMGDTVLEAFCGKDCAFLASWLRAFKYGTSFVPHLKLFKFKYF